MDIPTEDAQLLNDLLMKINEVVTGKDGISELTFYKHEMFNKVLKNYFSICQIENGYEITYKDKKANVKDFSGIVVLFRTILETLTLFYYIYCDVENQDDIDYRFKCWQRHGLVTRQNFGNFSPDQKLKLEEEKKILQELEESIVSNQRYLSLEHRQKGKFKRNGEWIFDSERTILERMGFESRFSGSIYAYLSSHAHAQSNGLLQLWQMDLNKETNSLIKIIKGQVIVVVYCFVSYYLKTRPEVKAEIDQKLIDKINFWKSVVVTREKIS